MKKLLIVVFGLLGLALIIKFFTKKDNEPVEPEIGSTASTVKNIPYTIIGEYPHDTASYTQGLEFYNGKLYESGGDYTSSLIQFGDAKTGKVIERTKMGTDKIFAEGITILNNKIYQLTYTTKQVFVYDVNNIKKPIQTLAWPFEQGWGLTNNGTDLLATISTDEIFTMDPTTLKVKSSVHVHDDNGPVQGINELEYVDGFIYANVYQTNDILKIDPATGAILGKMNFNSIDLRDKTDADHKPDVLNGIAYNKESKTFFITGKRWPKMFEIKLN
jgi:glutaminyl-peptide cyclotransferase